MEEILREISMPELVSAAEANMQAGFCLESHFIAGSQFFDTPELIGSTKPGGGCIYRASFSPEQTGEKIQQVLQRYRSEGWWPMEWAVSPASQPPELGKQLEAQGFRWELSLQVMAVALRTLEYHQVLPDGFVIERIQDLTQLQQWTEILLAVHYISESKSKLISEISKQYGFGSDAPYQFFVGLLDGQPVASARLYCAGGVAGIYHVITLPDVRGRGFGTAMTLAAAQAGLEAGYQVGLLFATAAGYGVYRRLGFREYYHMDVYESPA